MRNLKLTLSYDGSDFVGWQIQPNGISVQAVVESAIEKITGERAKLFAAGRTDSGVHALGQVVNFTSETTIPCENLRRGLQNFLPKSVIVREVEDVPADFHATYSAVGKRYRYVIHQHPIRSPFLKRYVWWRRDELDVSQMQAAAKRLLGTHDFRCFESQFPNKATSVRTIEQADWFSQAQWPAWEACSLETPPVSSAAFLCFEVVADGFLYNMVRAIVGTLVKVGWGKWPPEKVTEIIENQDRSQAGETAPPQGLYLVSVDYKDT